MTQVQAKAAARQIPFSIDWALPVNVEDGLRRTVDKQLRRLARHADNIRGHMYYSRERS